MHSDPSEPRTSARPGSAEDFSLGGWQPLADRVWTATAEPAAVNVTVVAGAQGVLVVDPGSSPAQGAAIRAAAEELAGLPVRAAVATHAHFDHAFGLAAFDDLTTFGHESVAAELTSTGAAEQARSLGFEPSELTAPNRPFALATGIDLGGRWVELAHLGAGHTAGDVVVVVGDVGLVLVGDLLESATPPWWGSDSAPEEWPSALDGVLGLMTSGRVRAVPGHGAPMGLEDAMLQRGQIAAVASEIERLLVAGVAVTDAVAQGSWPFPDAHVTAGVLAGYRRLIARGVGPSRDLPITSV